MSGDTLDDAPKKKHHGFQKGVISNPKGRPKGSRNKLGEAFLAALHEDFAQHGERVIAQVRLEKPEQYLKVIASTLPKELHVNTNALGEMSDDELTATLHALRNLATTYDAQISRARDAEEDGEETPGDLQPLH